MAEFDPGPPAAVAEIFDRVPAPGDTAAFWFDWGPIFYRGRLDGSARVLCVASDPGPTERVAGRTLVGNAGQRVQGLLSKLGLTRSYVCLNAWAYAVHPSHADEQQDALDEPGQLAWRNELYDAATGPDLQAVIAFGVMARKAIALWPGAQAVAVHNLPHPSSHNETRLLDTWRAAVADLRAIVTPDGDGDNSGETYGATFAETDYAPIPHRDLPFGVPAFMGDDAWVRAQDGGAMNSVGRPSPDDGHTLTWKAPDSGA